MVNILRRADRRSAGWRFKALVALLAATLAAALSWGAVHADGVYVDVAINGQLIEEGALVVGDRTYVRVSDVADVLGGRYIYDSDLKVAFVLTGVYQNLVADRLAARNPELEAYNPIAPIASHLGIRYGVPGPHLSIGFTPSGIVTAFEVLYTAGAVPHQPWFDQQNAVLEEIPGIGWAFSQHLHLIDPELITVGGHTKIAFNGEALEVSVDAIMWVGNELYVRLRDLAAASGGGVGWDTAARLATAKVVAGRDLTFDHLVALNERMAGHYVVASDFDPDYGYRAAPPGPGIEVGLDFANRVVVFGVNFPEDAGPWFPWYDQPNSAAADIPGFGRGYSQHIFVNE